MNRNNVPANKEIVFSLNSVLANEFALFTKTLNYHWNVSGPRFNSLHTFLGDHYAQLLLIMDEVAERVRVLDARPLSTIKAMSTNMKIRENDDMDLSAEKMLENLSVDHQTIQSQIKEILTNKNAFEADPGSQDFFVSVLRKHEVMNWKLFSHITK